MKINTCPNCGHSWSKKPIVSDAKYKKRWVEKNRDKIKIYTKKHDKERRDQLRDWYIKRQIKATGYRGIITSKMIDLKRKSLQEFRARKMERLALKDFKKHFKNMK